MPCAGWFGKRPRRLGCVLQRHERKHSPRIDIGNIGEMTPCTCVCVGTHRCRCHPGECAGRDMLDDWPRQLEHDTRAAVTVSKHESHAHSIP